MAQFKPLYPEVSEPFVSNNKMVIGKYELAEKDAPQPDEEYGKTKLAGENIILPGNWKINIIKQWME